MNIDTLCTYFIEMRFFKIVYFVKHVCLKSSFFSAANKDFLPLNEVVSFAAGEKYKTVSVAITDNSLQNELRRPFKVVLLLEKLQPGVALVPEKSSVEVVILDNDS